MPNLVQNMHNKQGHKLTLVLRELDLTLEYDYFNGTLNVEWPQKHTA